MFRGFGGGGSGGVWEWQTEGKGEERREGERRDGEREREWEAQTLRPSLRDHCLPSHHLPGARWSILSCRLRQPRPSLRRPSRPARHS